MTTKLQDVQQAQRQWFSRENKRFFGDVNYKVLHGKVSHNPYLVCSTYAWNDMSGRKRTLSWRINPLDDNLIIQPLIDESFSALEWVKLWLEDN